MLSHTVLDSIALGYEPVWNRARELAAVRLGVRAVHPESVDAHHLMQALGDDWPESAPVLILGVENPRLLQQAMACAPVHNTWLEVPGVWFEAPETLARVQAAARSGHQILRRTDLAALQGRIGGPGEVRNLLRLGAQGMPAGLLGQLVEGVTTQTLARECLDRAGAWGLLDWPEDDVLNAHRHQPLNYDAGVIRQVLRAIEDEDCSIEHLERLVRQDPVLVYRILMLVNSAAYGLRHEIASLRHALMMLGFRELGRWLVDQLPSSEPDRDLHPVRYAMVMRARLAQHLLASGSDDALRGEVYTTALLARLDRLLHQPLADLLHRLPLAGRVYDALLRHDGPYHPLLDVARAMGERGQLHSVPAVCQRHDISLEHANRALIRMLATSRDHASKRSERMT
ncbi:HDOD domain-containing protein [Hydrogenophaga sp.]|uniref:HDOD domain-containing protein n=1 Tax=Hydrogenophaga sp. TaxID=1904254 RepID=UPI00261ACC8E|nr:HDOD domain-containing protein [Hydrogenophaga sp.]MCW5655638.1 HDOD domain-containing protein [Hydrogenophaga sp.]